MFYNYYLVIMETPLNHHKPLPETILYRSISDAAVDTATAIHGFHESVWCDRTGFEASLEVLRKVGQIDPPASYDASDVEASINSIENDMSLLFPNASPRNIRAAACMSLMALQLQTVSQNPRFHNLGYPFEAVKSYKDELVSVSISKNRPLHLNEQLAIASNIANGEAVQSLFLLMIASRQYSRWQDSPMFAGEVPNDPDEIIAEMLDFYRAIAPSSPKHEGDTTNDNAGDNYYLWTHSLGIVANSLVRSKIVSRELQSFSRLGTKLMEAFFDPTKEKDAKLAPNVSVRHSHMVAANHGNKIGQLIVAELSDRQ